MSISLLFISMLTLMVMLEYI